MPRDGALSEYGITLPMMGPYPGDTGAPIWLYRGEVHYIVDIGAHAGVLGLCGAANHDVRRIRFYEANLNVINGFLLPNLQQNPQWQHLCEISHKAVWDETGLQVAITDAGGCSKIDDEGELPVETIAFKDILSGHKEPIDYLKLDIEGGEWSFFQHDDELVELMQKVKVLDFEMHNQPSCAGLLKSCWPQPQNGMSVEWARDTLIPAVDHYITEKMGFTRVTKLITGKQYYQELDGVQIGDWKRHIYVRNGEFNEFRTPTQS